MRVNDQKEKLHQKSQNKNESLISARIIQPSYSTSVESQDKLIIKYAKKQHQRPRAANVFFASQEYGKRGKDIVGKQNDNFEFNYKPQRKSKAKSNHSSVDEDYDEMRLGTGKK